MKDISANIQSQVDAQENRPFELYDIYLHPTDESKILRLTTHHDNIQFYSPEGVLKTYLAVPIERGEIEQDAHSKVSQVTVRICNVNQAMASYAAGNELRWHPVTIRKLFKDAMQNAEDAVYIIKDALIDSYVITEAWCEAVLVSPLGTLNAECPRWHYQLLCNRKFADAGCGVNENSSENKKTKTADAGCSAAEIIDAELTEEDAYWQDGEAEFIDGALAGEKRRIIQSEIGKCTVDFAFSSAPSEGDNYQIKRGCDKTLSSCKDKFSNQINYGGYDTIPQEMVVR